VTSDLLDGISWDGDGSACKAVANFLKIFDDASKVKVAAGNTAEGKALLQNKKGRSGSGLSVDNCFVLSAVVP
jgi:hypothetical protein